MVDPGYRLSVQDTVPSRITPHCPNDKPMRVFLDCLPSFPGLKASERTQVQNEWMEEKVPVIVATISFGMGVDKANVR